MQSAAQVLIDAGLRGPIDAAIVLGTGLNSLAQSITPDFDITYDKLAGFPATSVSGHAAHLIVGHWHGKRVLFLQGRSHYYEDGNPRAMAAPLEMLAQIGCRQLILTAACGSLREDLPPGSLMLVTDHINLNGPNPLIGARGDERFVSMVDAYDPMLRHALKHAAERSNIALGEGVYMWFTGPSFETPAEIRMAQSLGADAIGMSLVPEAILARARGLKLAALGMMTNYGAGFFGGAPTHAETRRVGLDGAANLQRLLDAFVKDLPDA
jgi:purine-nucleoside phosphorylase